MGQMGRENIWDIERTLRNIKPEFLRAIARMNTPEVLQAIVKMNMPGGLRAMAQMSTPEVLRAMEILGSPTWRYAQDVIKSYNKLFPSRAEARLRPSCTEAETERPPALQPPKRRPRGKKTGPATEAWRAKAEARLMVAVAQWMEKATAYAKSRSEREAKRGKSPKLAKSVLLEEAKRAGAPKDMTKLSRHFITWRGTLPGEIVDRKNRNTKA